VFRSNHALVYTEKLVVDATLVAWLTVRTWSEKQNAYSVGKSTTGLENSDKKGIYYVYSW